MTPQLQQAIRMLQLSRMELIEEVQKELLDNPLLEEKDDSYADSQTSSSTEDKKETDDSTGSDNFDNQEQSSFDDVQFDNEHGDQIARYEMEWDRYDDDRPEYHKQALSDP